MYVEERMYTLKTDDGMKVQLKHLPPARST
jgi:hypothetical protein